MSEANLPALELTPEQVRGLRLRAQGLAVPRPRAGLADAARKVCGLQAQLTAALLLALRARVVGLTAEDFAAATGEKRTLARSWLMRGTLHAVPVEDLRWLNALFAPVLIPKGKGRRAQLGLDDATAALGLEKLKGVLGEGEPLTRGEIVERLAAAGFALERRSQAPIHLLGLAALEGLLCLGADLPNGETTFVALDAWVEPGRVLPRDEALTEMARRYLAGFAPASVKDFAAWAGLTLTEARRGWEGLAAAETLVEVRVEGKTLWLPESAVDIAAGDDLSVRLLPAFDTYLLGYADRDLIVTPEWQQAVYHGGQTVPVVLVNGAAAGVWRYKRQGKKLAITVQAFEEFSADVRALVEAEAEDIGRLWQTKAAVSYTTEPL